ncbi:MAG: metallophosphoesterase [Lachnospiraceae bacterium]|nr:metallophosphoesterase [Lachnospiraceae bacterium]MBO7599617.1 metallophosphoesterase [Lachnospiraceae bacterium]
MKILVIPDVHLKPWIFDKAEAALISGAADSAVCLMDISDDWNMEYNTDLYEETYKRALKFSKDFESTRWCYGNHDVCYAWGQLESGYSVYAEATVCKMLYELEAELLWNKRLAFVQRIDNVIFSHAGLKAGFVKEIVKKHKEYADDIDTVISFINTLNRERLWANDSPLWYRPQMNNKDVWVREPFIQVVGHTPVEEIYEDKRVISTDVFSTYRDGRQIGESAFLIIDSKTCEWRKYSV